MLLFKNEQDFQQACERLGIGKVAITYPGGRQKIGLGRCIDGPRAMRMLNGLYLQAGLMVSRTHPAATNEGWFGGTR